MSDLNQSLFERMGGREVLLRINQVFYDKMYAHPWLSLYFQDVPQNVIEEQQTDFMMNAFGGPNIYCGKPPIRAHWHIYITEEVFDLREQLLIEAFNELSIDSEVQEAWLKIDRAFKSSIVKQDIKDCRPRYNNDSVKVFADPRKKVA